MAGCSLEACRRYGTGRWWKRKEKFGERRSGGPRPENRLKRRRRREGKKEKKKMMMMMMKEEEDEEEAMNTNLAKNDAIFCTISHGTISVVTTFA